MRHNKQVAANIDAIRADVEAATSQADLIRVIRSVENHPGPLDYDDRIAATIKWLLLFIGTMGLYLTASTSGFHGEIGFFLEIAMHFSRAWVPATGVVLLAIKLEKKGKVLPLPDSINRAWLRLGLIGVAAAAFFAIHPSWGYAYMTVIYTLIDLLGQLGALAPLAGFPIVQESTLGMLIICASLWIWQGKRLYWREPVSDRIQLLDSLFNNNQKPVKVSKSGKAQELGNKFREFNRGNHQREIEALYQGSYKGKVHQFDFQLYHFHFVDKRTETYTDSAGNTKTRTSYRHYNRHGLLVRFPFARSVSLDGDRRIKFDGVPYSSASNEFNRRFKVQAQEEIQAARLLSPAVVEQLCNIGDSYLSPVIEINAEGEMCIAFDNDDLLKQKCQYGLDKPEAFANEIAGHAKLDKLDSLLEVVHNLMRLNDNNFA